MGVLSTFGKLLIVAALIFQAFLLFQDKSTINSFDRQLNAALTSCHCEWITPEIQALVKEHLRMAIVSLLGSSLLFVVLRCWFFKVPTLLALFILLWVEHHASLTKIPSLDNAALWHSLGVIGTIIYLIGAECGSCAKSCAAPAAAAQEEKAAEKKSQKSKRQ